MFASVTYPGAGAGGTPRMAVLDGRLIVSGTRLMELRAGAAELDPLDLAFAPGSRAAALVAVGPSALAIAVEGRQQALVLASLAPGAASATSADLSWAPPLALCSPEPGEVVVSAADGALYPFHCAAGEPLTPLVAAESALVAALGALPAPALALDYRWGVAAAGCQDGSLLLGEERLRLDAPATAVRLFDGGRRLLHGDGDGVAAVLEKGGAREVLPRPTRDTAGDVVTCVHAADVDADGCDELLVGTFSQELRLYSSASGPWALRSAQALGEPLFQIDAADLDGDGVDEIVVATLTAVHHLSLSSAALQPLVDRVQRAAQLASEIEGLRAQLRLK